MAQTAGNSCTACSRRLVPTWAKDARLAGADWLVVSDCFDGVDPRTWEAETKDRVVLSHCPEAEDVAVVYGKLASMIRSRKPRSIRVLTVECSPHCYTLQAAVQEAIYISGAYDIPLSLAVWHDGDVKPISNEAIRVSRYLHLVEELIQNQPEILATLRRSSLEHSAEVDCR